jgi:hypothetical protein
MFWEHFTAPKIHVWVRRNEWPDSVWGQLYPGTYENLEDRKTPEWTGGLQKGWLHVKMLITFRKTGYNFACALNSSFWWEWRRKTTTNSTEIDALWQEEARGSGEILWSHTRYLRVDKKVTGLNFSPVRSDTDRSNISSRVSFTTVRITFFGLFAALKQTEAELHISVDLWTWHKC